VHSEPGWAGRGITPVMRNSVRLRRGALLLVGCAEAVRGASSTATWMGERDRGVDRGGMVGFGGRSSGGGGGMLVVGCWLLVGGRWKVFVNVCVWCVPALYIADGEN
jgi:hypothetical protein